MPIHPIKTNNEKSARSAKNKSNLFAEHFEETFQSLGRHISHENITYMSRTSDYEDVRPDYEDIRPVRFLGKICANAVKSSRSNKNAET